MIKILQNLLAPYARTIAITFTVLAVISLGLGWWHYTGLLSQIQDLKVSQANQSKTIKDLELEAKAKATEYQATIEALGTNLKNKEATVKKHKQAREQLHKALDEISDGCMKQSIPEGVRQVLEGL